MLFIDIFTYKYGIHATDLVWHSCHTLGKMSKESRLFAKKMRALRIEKGMTQLELAEETGLDLTTINELENGRREPKLGTIKRVAKSLGLSLSVLLV